MEVGFVDTIIPLILMLSFLTAVDGSQTDLDRIQGIWVLIRMESGGKEVQSEMSMRGDYHLMLVGDKVIVNQEGTIRPIGTLKLDPAQRTKLYDRILTDGRLWRGIYELDGDHLRTCLNFAGLDRPKDFSTKEGEQTQLMVFKRYDPQPAAIAPGPGSSAEQILTAIDSLTMSAFDVQRMHDRAYVGEYQAQELVRSKQRSERILELYTAAPTHQRMPALMVERWRRASPATRDAQAQLAEIDDVLAHSTSRYLRVEGAYIKARAKLFKDRSAGSPDLSGVEEFLKLSPELSPEEVDRGSSLLYTAVSMTHDQAKREALEDRILREFPDSTFAGAVRQDRKQRALVGKPFDLEFIDVISGSKVAMKTLKGKLVVVDFWATWCGPCVADIPRMKELYAKYRNHGVEFIGVSLDEPIARGGLDSLKRFVRERQINWPQYYLGERESEFTRSWGLLQHAVSRWRGRRTREGKTLREADSGSWWSPYGSDARQSQDRGSNAQHNVGTGSRRTRDPCCLRRR
jgi:uncharacterized protein (TIGR03067 family)